MRRLFTGWIAFAALLLVSSGAQAQVIRFPAGPSIDVGLGLSSLKFDDGDVRRSSVLPELTAGVHYPILLDTSLVVRPGAGLQFDGVGFHSLQEYQDRFLIGSVRAGVLFLGTSGGTEAGIGFELRKPVYRRSEVYSRNRPQGRDWTETSHPEQLDGWNAFWVLHLGVRVGRQMIVAAVTYENRGRTPWSGLLPRSEMDYISMRLGAHFKPY